MRGYQQILKLFDAWDERDDEIPFGDLVAVTHGSGARASRPGRCVDFRATATTAASPSAAGRITRHSCCAGRVASGALSTIIWVPHASFGLSKGRQPRPSTSSAHAAGFSPGGLAPTRREALRGVAMKRSTRWAICKPLAKT